MTEEPIRIDTENVLAREVEGETVILDLRSQRYVGGNRSVTVLWPLLEEGATRDRLAQQLVEEFGVPSEKAASDVEAFVDQLTDLGLVRTD